MTIENIKFAPATLAAKKGDTIIWKNKDIVPHTVTEDSLTKPAFDSGQINPEGEYEMKIKHSGQIAYKCLFHPAMKAEIKVP